MQKTMLVAGIIGLIFAVIATISKEISQTLSISIFAISSVVFFIIFELFRIIYILINKKPGSDICDMFPEPETEPDYLQNKRNMIFITGMGIFMLLYAIFSLYRYMDTYRWIETPCVIQKIDEEIISGGDGSSDDVRNRYVIYSYTVDGKNYTSNKTYAGSLFFSSGRALTPEIEEQYRNKKGTCYVNPLSHSDAVLLKGDENEYFECVIIVFVGFLFIICGLWTIYAKHIRIIKINILEKIAVILGRG